MADFSPQVRILWSLTDPCTLCPRQCRTERSKGRLGFCGIADMPAVSSIGPHFGEKSVLVGPGGSGTIFLAGCNLGCAWPYANPSTNTPSRGGGTLKLCLGVVLHGRKTVKIYWHWSVDFALSIPGTGIIPLLSRSYQFSSNRIVVNVPYSTCKRVG